jgi:DNA polymerase III subunit gamma/tau
MSYLVLARKYRSQAFDEVVAQRHVTQTLKNAIASDRLAHAILLTGPRGTGKTTIARILAKAMNCKTGPTPTPCNTCRSCSEITAGSATDVFEIDGASNNGVEQVRDIRENIKYMPAHSPFKIYIIDEVHMLSTAAFNALLKTLEEPPAHVIFLFATTEPRKIPMTILSRCQRYDLKRIETAAIIQHLKSICRKEGIDIADESMDYIARDADGSMRDALSLLDQVTTGVDGPLTHSQVLDVLGVVDRQIVFELADAVFTGDAPRILDIIDTVYQYGHHMLDLYARLIEHVRNLLVTKLSPDFRGLKDLSSEEIAILNRQADTVSTLHLNQILEVLFTEERHLKGSLRPQMAFEVVMIKLLNIRPALPIDELIEKIDGLQKKFSSGQNLSLSEDQKRFDTSDPAVSIEPPANQRTNTFPVDASRSDTDAAATGDPKDPWPAMLDIISERYPSLAPNLNHSKLIKQSENSIEIEVNGSRFNYQRMCSKENIKILEDIARSFYGRQMTVVIQAGTNKNGQPQKEKIHTANRLKQDLLHHPLVADAIEIFNGKLVDIKAG